MNVLIAMIFFAFQVVDDGKNQDLLDLEELINLEKSLLQQDLHIRELVNAQTRAKSGERIPTLTLVPKQPFDVTVSLQDLRQEILSLQQECEELQVELEPEPIVVVVEPETPVEKDPLAKNPHVKPDTKKLGPVLMKMGKWEEAGALYDAQEDPWSKFYSAYCLEMQGKWESALSSYRKLASDSPQSSAGIHAGKVRELLEQRMKFGSIKDYEFYVQKLQAGETAK